MNRNEALSIAKKLKSLAEGTVGSERNVAEKKLRVFCEKHSLDVNEFSTDTVRVNVSYENSQEREILKGIISMILCSSSVSATDKNNTFSFRCTQHQYNDILDAFEHYKVTYYEYLHDVSVAFVLKNELYNKEPEKPTCPMEEMTDEEKKTYADLVNAKSNDVSESSEKPSPSGKTKEENAKWNRHRQSVRQLLSVVPQNKWYRRFVPKLFLR